LTIGTVFNCATVVGEEYLKTQKYFKSTGAGTTVVGPSFATGNGQFTVNVYFSESYFKLAGKRVFDVIAEGQTVISQLDVFTEVGFNVAYMTSFDVTVTDGSLDLSFVATADNPLMNAIEVYMTTTVSSGPSAMDFGSVYESSSASDSLYVYFWNGEEAYINAATCTDDSFTVALEMPFLMSGNSIPILFAPTTPGSKSGVLTIETSYGSISVAVSGVGVASPISLVASADLAFGSVLLGSSYTMTVTISNTGSSAATIDTLEISEPFTFAEISTPFTVAAGETFDVEVTFAPVEEGVVSGNLIIQSGSGKLYVSLTGEGSATYTTLYRINSGSKTEVYTDEELHEWAVDQYFTNGLVYVNTASVTANGVNLYNTERYWTDKTVKGSYGFPVTAGTYRVDMQFMESWAKAAGVRMFDIYVNGVLVEGSFDIYATAGFNIAHTISSQIVTFEVDATLLVEFAHVFAEDGVTSYNNPKVNAIEVVKLG
jgi:hypothetical protein